MQLFPLEKVVFAGVDRLAGAGISAGKLMQFQPQNWLIVAPILNPLVYCFGAKFSTTSPIKPASQTTENKGLAKNFKKSVGEDSPQ